MFILKQLQIIIIILGGEYLRLCLWEMDPLAPAVLFGNLVATCKQDASMDMDMDVKFHIHGKPGSI